MRKRLATLFVTVAVTTGLAAAPASSQGPIVTGGLVNVTITDSLNNILSNNNVTVGAALGVAANVCGVPVSVLAQQIRTGDITCTSDASGQTVDIGPVSQ